MKYALIGCGRVAPSHIKAAKANGLEIVAVCDIIKEKAEQFRADRDIPDARVYTDYKEMLSQEQVDFVSIATISGTHGEIALYCAENKVNFLVEKPMAMSIAEADAIIAAAEKSGVIAGVCHQNRFNIAVQELKYAIDKGRFGQLTHGSIQVRWCREKDYYDSDDWRGKYATDGGALMNQCIHGIDLLRWCFGDEVESVFGVTKNQLHPYIEAEDIGLAIVSFKNGAVATIEGTVNMYDNLENVLSVFGNDGMVKLGGMNSSATDVWKFRDEEEADRDRREIEEKIANVYGNGHTSLFMDFIDAVKNNRSPYVDLYAGKRAVEMILAIYKSQKTGEKVVFPLTDFGTTDMI